jgi:hypothetical protein
MTPQEANIAAVTACEAQDRNILIAHSLTDDIMLRKILLRLDRRCQANKPWLSSMG